MENGSSFHRGRESQMRVFRFCSGKKGGVGLRCGLALGALALATGAAAAAPAKIPPCIDPGTCRSAATADAPRQLQLLPTPARLTTGADGKSVWTVPVLGWVYAPISAARSECKGTLAALTREALSVLVRPSPPSAGSPPPSDPPNTNRLPRFFVDNLCNQKVKISLGGGAGAAVPQTLQPAADDPFCQTLLLFPDEQLAPKLTPATDAGGLFCGKLLLSPELVQSLSPQGQPLRLQAELLPDSGAGVGVPAAPLARDSAEAFLLRDTATEISIISDIDDTVRISHVAYKPELLRGTFFAPFRPTPGVAELYARWQAHSPGLALHFISSSPLPLYKPLRDELMTQHPFPLATYHLKWFRIREGTTIELLAKSPLLTKRRQIAPLLKTYPHRRFALVGDSGERDPEVYTNLVSDKLLLPGQLTGIFIRDVTCDAQGIHTRPVATGAVGAVEDTGRQIGRAVQDHLPGGERHTCRERRFRDVLRAFAAAVKSQGGPHAAAPWRAWCVFAGGDTAADAALVPPLLTPELTDRTGPTSVEVVVRPAECWPHSQAEFDAALSN